MRKFFLISLVMMLLLTCGCSQPKSTPTVAEKLGVAVTIPPQQTFVKAVGGKQVKVVTMIPPGNSPGNYAPSPKELTKFSQAEVYFSMGVPADKVNILPKAKEINNDLQIVRINKKVAKVYPPRKLSGGGRDPHIWLSPKRVKLMVNIIADKLSALVPKHKQQFHQNAAQYITKLEQLDQKINQVLTSVKQQSFIVYHPAFGYFAEEYGLSMIAIERAGKEASPQRMEKIIKRARRKKIKVIFHQAQIDSQQVEAIARALGGRAIQLNPLAVNYRENLLSIAKTLREALQEGGK